jgi:lysophospholipase L1-like esterase
VAFLKIETLARALLRVLHCDTKKAQGDLMTHGTVSNMATTLSLFAALGLQAACASDSGKADGAGTLGTSAPDAGNSAADPCNAGPCVPSGFPFVTRALAISDSCGSNCPLSAANTPAGESTATLSQPKAGTLCLSGMVSPGGWAQIGLIFAVKNQDRTEVLKKFDAKALGITQVAFSIDSPPSGGVDVSAAITTATSCPGDSFGCFTYGFDLMAGAGSSVPADYTTPGQVIAPFANFLQTVGTQSFDTSALEHLVFGVGPGSYDFCIHDFKFLDAQGNEVMEPQQPDGGVIDAGTGGGDSATNGHDGSIIATLDSGGETSLGKYVAMGSSYAAGPKIPDAVPNQSCGRSTGNYAHLVATALGLDLTEVSCIGATIDNVTTTPQTMNPLQIEAVTPDTRVITITIGGNDVNYSASLVACGRDGANGQSCLETSADAAAPDVDSPAIDSLLNQVENKLVAMLGKVQQAAPTARIYLVAYPMVLPEPAVPCPPDVPMQPADAIFLGTVGARLQAAFSSAAAIAGVSFVDVYGPSHGHDACAPADQRWVEGQANPAVAPYHPNAAGMRAVADLIVAEIRKANGR